MSFIQVSGRPMLASTWGRGSEAALVRIESYIDDLKKPGNARNKQQRINQIDVLEKQKKEILDKDKREKEKEDKVAEEKLKSIQEKEKLFTNIDYICKKHTEGDILAKWELKQILGSYYKKIKDLNLELEEDKKNIKIKEIKMEILKISKLISDDITSIMLSELPENKIPDLEILILKTLLNEKLINSINININPDIILTNLVDDIISEIEIILSKNYVCNEANYKIKNKIQNNKQMYLTFLPQQINSQKLEIPKFKTINEKMIEELTKCEKCVYRTNPEHIIVNISKNGYIEKEKEYKVKIEDFQSVIIQIEKYKNMYGIK